MVSCWIRHPRIPHGVNCATFRRAPGREVVELAVYDVTGRLVQDFGTVARADGVIRSVAWNTEGAAPGTYFAVLRAGEAKLTRKIVVAK